MEKAACALTLSNKPQVWVHKHKSLMNTCFNKAMVYETKVPSDSKMNELNAKSSFMK